MAHRIEADRLLPVTTGQGPGSDPRLPWEKMDAALVRVPPATSGPAGARGRQAALLAEILSLAHQLPENAELVLYGEPFDLCRLLAGLPDAWRYHLWVAVRTGVTGSGGLLPREHLGLLFLGKGCPALVHARLRVGYRYCPACDRTTKDYGGRKHLYDAFGTLASDVWKDETAPPDGELPPWLIERVAGLLSTPERRGMAVVHLGQPGAGDPAVPVRAAAGPEPPAAFPAGPETCRERSDPLAAGPAAGGDHWSNGHGSLWCGDAIDLLASVPEGCADLVFADPPYNLAKAYAGGRDLLAGDEYLDWCDRWLAAAARAVVPGGILAVLNLPAACARHVALLGGVMEPLHWVAWESMSLPARAIMPSHYGLVLFRRPGACRSSAGTGRAGSDAAPGPRGGPAGEDEDRAALSHGFCLRPGCVRGRKREACTQPATDLWCDLHRLKHNSQRRDHPCQLPPRLMRRLLSIATRPGDRVVDPFNGIGTTTLVAQSMGRRFLGIEHSPEYHRTACERHRLLDAGGDPFSRCERPPAVKNNRVRRQARRGYPVPKRTIQLQIRELSLRLGRMPTREDALAHLPYPEALYGDCFKSWSEVLAAARTTGMSERRG